MANAESNAASWLRQAPDGTDTGRAAQQEEQGPAGLGFASPAGQLCGGGIRSELVGTLLQRPWTTVQNGAEGRPLCRPCGNRTSQE